MHVENAATHPINPWNFRNSKSSTAGHGSLNVPMFHTQPLDIWSIRWLLFQVMSNISKSWDSYQPLQDFPVFFGGKWMIKLHQTRLCWSWNCSAESRNLPPRPPRPLRPALAGRDLPPAPGVGALEHWEAPNSQGLNQKIPICGPFILHDLGCTCTKCLCYLGNYCCAHFLTHRKRASRKANNLG